MASTDLLGARTRPQVLLARPVLASELPALGIDVNRGWFGPRSFRDGNLPLALVVLDGDFDTNLMWFTGGYRGQLPESSSRFRFGYVVYDLRSVQAVVWELVRSDEELQQILRGLADDADPLVTR